MAQSDVDTLNEAAKGLLYMSETDAPFEAFNWGKDAGGLDDARVRQLSGHDAKEPVERDDLDEFFSTMLEGEDAAKARTLVDAIRQTLSDVRVYRVGKISIDAFVVGKTKDGELVGIKTKLVET